MNWTGGQLKRIKANTLSVKNQERLIQRHYIRRKEMEKINQNMKLLKLNSETKSEPTINSKSHSKSDPKSDPNNEKTRHERRSVKTKLPKVVKKCGQSSVNSFKRRPKQTKNYSKTESEVKYFNEVMDQLFWTLNQREEKDLKSIESNKTFISFNNIFK